LVIVVLLQKGKGSDVSAVFGGSSQTIFGSSGAGNFLTKLTSATAIVFMFTSLSLTVGTTKQETKSVFDDIPTEATPVTPPEQAPATPSAESGAPTAAATSAEKPADAPPAGGATVTTTPVPASPAATAPAATTPPATPSAPAAPAAAEKK
jgi:preprotein translocase subunit SecG